jgi:hypothetical protein
MADSNTIQNRSVVVFWLFMSIALGLLVFIYVMHRNSYCFAESRFVSDEEIIDAAIREEVEYLQAVKTKYGRKIVTFKDKEEFLKSFPNCCKILRGSEEREAYNFNGFLNVFFGYYGSAVEIKYILKLAEKSGGFVEAPVIPIRVVNSCGIAGLGENDLGNYYFPDL